MHVKQVILMQKFVIIATLTFKCILGVISMCITKVYRDRVTSIKSWSNFYLLDKINYLLTNTKLSNNNKIKNVIEFSKT